MIKTGYFVLDSDIFSVLSPPPYRRVIARTIERQSFVARAHPLVSIDHTSGECAIVISSRENSKSFSISSRSSAWHDTFHLSNLAPVLLSPPHLLVHQ